MSLIAKQEARNLANNTLQEYRRQCSPETPADELKAFLLLQSSLTNEIEALLGVAGLGWLE